MRTTSLVSTNRPNLESPSETNYTSGNQLLYRATNLRILHVFLQGGRIILGLLEDALHDWVRENLDNLMERLEE
jgi:hypothetical protein